MQAHAETRDPELSPGFHDHGRRITSQYRFLRARPDGFDPDRSCTLADAQLSASDPAERAVHRLHRLTRCRFAHADLREATFTRCNFADPDSHSGVHPFAFSQMDQAVFEASATLSISPMLTAPAPGRSRFGPQTSRARVVPPRRLQPVIRGQDEVRTAAAFTARNLELADLSDARGFRPATSRGSSLREADLTEANLEGHPRSDRLRSFPGADHGREPEQRRPEGRGGFRSQPGRPRRL